MGGLKAKPMTRAQIIRQSDAAAGGGERAPDQHQQQQQQQQHAQAPVAVNKAGGPSVVCSHKHVFARLNARVEAQKVYVCFCARNIYWW